MSTQYDEELRISKGGSISTLSCPSCRGENLHQEAVSVYWRSEDKKEGLKVNTFSQGSPGERVPQVRITTDQEGNPSSRRDGIRIRFMCEECSDLPSLVISQHKGATFIHWEVPEEFKRC